MNAAGLSLEVWIAGNAGRLVAAPVDRRAIRITTNTHASKIANKVTDRSHSVPGFGATAADKIPMYTIHFTASSD